jgi:putative oxidoreductase
MAYGVLLIRLVLGLTMAGHGSRALFGSVGGRGLHGTSDEFDKLGFRAPALVALAAGAAELGGGLFLAAGLLTPLAAVAIAVVMVNAIATVHWRRGFWNSDGGYEYLLLIWMTVVSLAAIGGSRFSLDRLYGWDDNISGLWWGVGALAASVLISALTLGIGRRKRVMEMPAGLNESVRRAA